MIGQILVHLLFGVSVATTVVAWRGMRTNDPRFAGWARTLLGLLAMGLVAASTFLIILILLHRFDYTYVWSYSSTELPLHLLIASFYSGQEGSFLLWTMFVALLGTFLIPYAKRHDYDAPVIFFFGLILVFLTLLLVAKNPFAYYYESFASQGIVPIDADIPKNGRGLNPLLHNAWITIHPPILFTGFAAMSVSFAFAMAGLVRRDYHRWIGIALPWTLFATAILGFGIMLGGFWAYETLGWGGFWGWDPVENSSLIPWLVSVALVHTMLVQRRTHGLVKTNMILAVTAFVMVLYSTFLTRSGILGDTSVHSFVDPGKFAFWILLLFMLTFVVLGVGLVLARRRDMNVNRQEFSPSTREFHLGIGAALIMASAILVTVGTSWPVLMEVLQQPKIAIAIDFYNNVHIILVPAVLLVNGLSLLLQWRHTTASTFRKRVVIAAVAAVGLTLLMLPFGILSGGALALAASAWFSLIVNVMMGWTLIRSSIAMAGAYVSHTGIALLIFGVITSSSYTETHHVTMLEDRPVEVGDYVLTYLGKEQIERQFVDREKFRYDVAIQRGSSADTVSAILYYSDFNQRQSPFLEPGIRWGLTTDLYVTPKATGTQDLGDIYPDSTIQRGSTFRHLSDSNVVLELQRFTMPMEEEQTDAHAMKMSAVLAVRGGGETSESLGTEFRVPVLVEQDPSGPIFTPTWTRVPGTSAEVAVTAITRNNDDPSKSTGTLVFRSATDTPITPKGIFTVDFSTKPLISLVWFGVIAMVAGFGFSIVRYSRLPTKKGPVTVSENSPLPGTQVTKDETADSNTQQS
ncbi:MAG TPA: cytochrome c-type biogenesis CcmF C-terminal domain-containing protein [Chlorobiota bacterium]|nr:cytochrome c-type biogenesis CcmF C-terminal domain-containing protein [Chlorobiota bacterium]